MDTGDRVTIGKIGGRPHPDNGKTGILKKHCWWWGVVLDDGSGEIKVRHDEVEPTKSKPRRKKK